MMYYTGIGSRQTPPHVCDLMTKAASSLQELRLVLRSGAAHGADAAFENGVSNSWMKQIFLPWQKFNGHPSTFYQRDDEAYEIAEKFHPAWDELSQGAKLLMARNAHQILGPKLNEPSLFVLCWTPDGKVQGGTGQSIRMAQHYEIPVFNLGRMDIEDVSYLILELIKEKTS